MTEFRATRGEKPSIPYIDPRVEHVGVSNLRQLDGKKLRQMDDKTLVIQEHNTPLAVLLSYEQYLIIQDQLQTVVDCFELLSSPEETAALISGLRDLRDGNTRSIGEIRKDLESEAGNKPK